MGMEILLIFVVVVVVVSRQNPEIGPYWSLLDWFAPFPLPRTTRISHKLKRNKDQRCI